MSGVNQMEQENALKLYPNHASNFIYLASDIKPSALRILSINGEEVLTIQNPTKKLEISTLSNSTYWIEAVSIDDIWRGKFIKLK